MRVIHIISGLNAGGAERMLLKLLPEFTARGIESAVVSLSGRGYLAPSIEALGIPLHTFDFAQVMTTPIQLLRLSRVIHDFRPNLVQTWMYHADFMGSLAARLAGKCNILWNIRQSSIDPNCLRWSTYHLIRLCARMARRWPRACLINSHNAIDAHVKIGYPPSIFRYVPNGFDLNGFIPSAAGRSSVRVELGLPAETLLVGLVARFDRQKDHVGFIAAMARCMEQRPDMHVVMIGQGVVADNPVLTAAVNRTSQPSNFHLLGLRDDMQRLTAALDIACSASCYGEGFPNTAGEAMACGIPCVLTDVGDCKEILGDGGLVVVPGDGAAFAGAILELAALDDETRRLIGTRGRARVRRNYELATVADQYEALYREFSS